MGSIVDESAASIRRQWAGTPRVGIILGTGLGNAVKLLDIQRTVPYSAIRHFPSSTALSHEGRLVCGLLQGVPTVVMAGRCHLYEGYTWHQVTLPVRAMWALGVRLLIVSNASGGLNPRFRGGEIMVIADHLNLMFRLGHATPLDHVGPACASSAVAERGLADQPTRPAAGSSRPRDWCYDPLLIDRAIEISRRRDFVAHRGVYVAVTGPNYETRAEYRLFRRIGGDAVGMSTVPEVLTAAQLGMRVLALSLITNVATPDAPQKIAAHEVVELAARAEPNLSQIVQGIVTSVRQ